jgi:NAD(P)-dependent dehydrogenase (short-subunit alcohol dehydrogenase family)
MNRLDGKVVVITGAASGIGEGMAREAASRGAMLMLVDRYDPATALAAVRAMGVRAESAICDVSDVAAVDALAARTLDLFGAVDVLLANAGGGVAGALQHTAPADFDRVMATNVNGVFYCLHAFAPALAAAAHPGEPSRLMITGSEHSFGLPPWGPMSAYTISKHALLGLADCARRDLAALNIKVTLLCPSWVLTRAVGGYLASSPALAAQVEPVVQTVEQVAVAALDALERGDFLAPTNLVSRGFALSRAAEVTHAFEGLAS